MSKQELAREYSEPKIKPAYEKAGRDKAFFTAEMLQQITENCYIAGFDKALELIEAWAKEDDDTPLLAKLKKLRGE